MRSAYLGARRAGYSRRESLRVALLVNRLSLRDPPTDVWGRPLQTATDDRQVSPRRASEGRDADSSPGW
jgi:hypothetical protein